ncbi:hypothetical protein KR026_005599, partial [Drosophila bipectinata]
KNAVTSPPNPETPLPPSNSPLYRFSRAAVCSDNNVCSLLSKSAMKKGGSAVDGALVSLFCTGLIGMQSMGLGGGMLMNVYSHKARKSYSILAREISPRLLRENNLSVFREEEEFKQSSWSIAVPTEMAGYAIAHQKFGRLSWSELVGPTTELCRRGYRLYKHQYDALIMNQEMVKRDPGLRNMFVNSDSGQFWRTGSHIQPPIQLCETYERLALEGPYSFYNGSIADDLAADLKEIGSVIDKEDLANTRATFTESVVLPFDEYDLHLTPPPGSGYILGFILNILREFRMDFEEAQSIGALQIHRMVEAMKFGFVQRWQLDEKSDTKILNKLFSPELSKSIAYKIDDLKTSNQSAFYGGSSDIRTRNEYGTAHISVLLDNDAVSVTSSINFYFGSGRIGKRTGVLFNNGMSDFSIEQLRNYFDLPFVMGKNMVAPSARPMSSMSPVIVTERSTGRVRLVVGAAGGAKIISSLVPLLVRVLWQKANIKNAIDASRIHHQMSPNVLLYEYGLIQKYVDLLRQRGHKCERYKHRGSVICGIVQNNGTVWSNSDFRKPGGVSGF